MTILGIETSCDDSAAAVLVDGELRSSIVSSQDRVHGPYGGVVPELASRSHSLCLGGLVEQALATAGMGMGNVDVFGATMGPGLASSLLVGSTAGQRGEAYHGDYASTKGAMISLVKGFCVELGARGITVNCVAPGWIDTEMSAGSLQGEGRKRIEAGIPIGRVASADDVAGDL